MIEAVSAELAFPAAIQHFSEGIRLIMESPATFQTDLSVTDAQGVSRERVDALMGAAGKYVVATPCISVTLTYRVPRVGEAKRDESSGLGETIRIARDDQILEDVQLLEPTRCLCTSPPTDSALPLSAVIRGGVGCTSERLTGEVAKRVVDWVRRDAMPR